MKRPILLTLAALSACATQHSDRSLLGHDLDDVRNRLGPPVTSSFGGGTWTLAYPDKNGAIVEGAVTLVDDVVINAAPDLRRNPLNASNRWTGASIEEVVATLGAGRVESVSTRGAVLRFGELTLHVVDGRVLGTVEERISKR